MEENKARKDMAQRPVRMVGGDCTKAGEEEGTSTEPGEEAIGVEDKDL